MIEKDEGQTKRYDLTGTTWEALMGLLTKVCKQRFGGSGFGLPVLLKASPNVHQIHEWRFLDMGRPVEIMASKTYYPPMQYCA